MFRILKISEICLTFNFEAIFLLYSFTQLPSTKEIKKFFPEPVATVLTCRCFGNGLSWQRVDMRVLFPCKLRNPAPIHPVVYPPPSHIPFCVFKARSSHYFCEWINMKRRRWCWMIRKKLQCCETFVEFVLGSRLDIPHFLYGFFLSVFCRLVVLDTRGRREFMPYQY